MAKSTDNLRYWRKMANVPKEHLKSFTKGGGFKGTDIKPQWRYQIMTETFGPCGSGWGMTQPQFQVERDQVYCTVGVWWMGDEEPSEPVWGVGGESLTGRGDDEAFKKAYTDALGNALVKIGVASDIYMGFFDGSKYVRKTEDPDAPEQEEGVQERQSAHAARKGDGGDHFKRISAGIDTITETGTLDDLVMFWKANWQHIKVMPQGWHSELTAKKDLAKAAFEAGLARPLEGLQDNPYTDAPPSDPYDGAPK